MRDEAVSVGEAVFDPILAELERAREGGTDRDALLKTAVRLLHESSPRYDWVGIYLLEGDVLVLHNYLGRPTDHERIAVGTGVCGTAVAEGRDINVPDVHAIDNYLACSVETRSELVVLMRTGGAGRVVGQIDLDSDEAGAFTPADEAGIRRVADWLSELFD